MPATSLASRGVREELELGRLRFPDRDETPMKFIVKPVTEDRIKPPTTQCVLCSEDPRWCL
jgi:hypothetical protein